MKGNIKVTFHYGSKNFEELIKFIISNKLKTKNIKLNINIDTTEDSKNEVSSAVQETERGEE